MRHLFALHFCVQLPLHLLRVNIVVALMATCLPLPFSTLYASTVRSCNHAIPATQMGIPKHVKAVCMPDHCALSHPAFVAETAQFHDSEPEV